MRALRFKLTNIAPLKKIENTLRKSRDEKKFRVGYNTDINKKHRERSMNEQRKRIIKQQQLTHNAFTMHT